MHLQDVFDLIILTGRDAVAVPVRIAPGATAAAAAMAAVCEDKRLQTMVDCSEVIRGLGGAGEAAATTRAGQPPCVAADDGSASSRS